MVWNASYRQVVTTYRWSPLMMFAGVIVFLMGAIFFGSLMRQTAPNFYHPGREALMNARERLDELFGQRIILVQQLRDTQESLYEAVVELNEAASQAPEHRGDIERLSRKARVLGDVNRLDQMSANQVKAVYGDLAQRVKTIAHEMESSHRHLERDGANNPSGNFR